VYIDESFFSEGSDMLDNSKIKLGIAPIGWTNDDMPELGGEIPFEQCISEMAQAGFTGTEVGSKYPKSPEALLAALKPHNLQIASQWFSAFFSVQADPTPTVDAFRQHMNFLKALGAKVVVISEQGHSIQGQMHTPLFEKKPTLNNQEWQWLAKGLNTIGKIAIENDMKIVFHHHMGTVVQTKKEIDKLMELTDPDLVFLLVDTGHISYSGDDPVELLRDYRKRIKHIHLKDIRKNIVEKVKKEKLSFLEGVKLGAFTVPGDGSIKFEPIFKEIEKMNYEGWLLVEAEQDPAKANPLVYAKKARDYIKKLGGI
jgi:inosose dehydratase